jgi:hypothetical protein
MATLKGLPKCSLSSYFKIANAVAGMTGMGW